MFNRDNMFKKNIKDLNLNKKNLLKLKNILEILINNPIIDIEPNSKIFNKKIINLILKKYQNNNINILTETKNINKIKFSSKNLGLGLKKKNNLAAMPVMPLKKKKITNKNLELAEVRSGLWNEPIKFPLKKSE